MRTGTLAFLLGILAVQFFHRLPPVWVAVLPIAILVPCIYFPRFRPAFFIVLFLTAGFAWQLIHAHRAISARLPAELEGRDIVIEGVIRDLPRHGARISRFVLQADRLLVEDSRQDIDWRLQLKWYGEGRMQLHAGQRWRLLVRLKLPHGFMNPGTFDYEKWLFSNGIAATGYVRGGTRPVLLGEGQGYAFWQPWREVISARIASSLPGHEMAGIVSALAVGDRSAMDNEHWRVLTVTGTSHLVAISGLHLGLVAGFIFWLGQFLARLNSRLCLHYPARTLASVMAITASVCYAGLAGFSVPTQRALVMVCVIMLDILLRRRTARLDTLALAMLVVLLLDPFAAMSAGFWLSFSAVAVIFLSLGTQPRKGSLFSQWGRVQWVVCLGLVPLLVILFGRVSLVAPLTNIVAVPWVSFISLPLVMLSLPALLFESTFLLELAADSLGRLWTWLDVVAGMHMASVTLPRTSWWASAIALAGIAWTLAPRGLPYRWLGLVCVLPLFLSRPLSPEYGAYRLSVLDVGQGLSVVVETANHVLVYDTGAAFSPGFDIGSAVILPVLQHKAVRAIDMLVVSHGDNDHNGGTRSVIGGLPVRQILSGEPKKIPARAEHCLAGRNWEWDGVSFEILHPVQASPLEKLSNNRSCVLRIINRRHASLLTGDIEARVERRLVSAYAEKLASSILIAPHHGSESSSTVAFIRAVTPEHVVFSTGYRNRFRFPRDAVRERFLQEGARLYQTDQTGMLVFDVLPDGRLETRSYRQQQARYWHTGDGIPPSIR